MDACADGDREIHFDRAAIHEIVQSWALYRDTGEWERLRSLWHENGRMVTTWCEVSADEFVHRARQAWEGGALNAVHFLGGTTVDIVGPRAVAQTRMTLVQRAAVHSVPVDVTCHGRFYDLLERRVDRWGIVLRHPIYEMDRLDPLDPSAGLSLDRALLDELPEGYRHLAYVQTLLGLNVNRDLPGRRGPALDRLLEAGRRWLGGAEILKSLDAAEPT